MADFDNELVQFQTLDGRLLNMTRGVANQLQAEGKGTFETTVPTAEGFAPEPQFEQPVPNPAEPTPPTSLSPESGPTVVMPSADDFVVNPVADSPQVATEPAPIEELLDTQEVQRQTPGVQVEIGDIEVLNDTDPEEIPVDDEIDPDAEPDVQGEDDLVSRHNRALERVSRGRRRVLEAEARGEFDTAQLLKRSIRQDEAFLNKRLGKAQKRRQMVESRITEKRARVQELTQELESARVEDRRGVGEKMLGGLMAALFQVGGAIRGQSGPNLALKIIQDGVRQDLDEQRRQIGTSKQLRSAAVNELGRLQNELGDTQAAEATLEDVRMRQAVKQAQAIAAQTRGTVKEAQAQALVDELSLEQSQTELRARSAREGAEAKLREKLLDLEGKKELKQLELAQKERESQRSHRRGVLGIRLDAEKERNRLAQQGIGKQEANNRLYAKLFRENKVGELESTVREMQELMAKTGGGTPQDFFSRLNNVSFLQRAQNADAGRMQQLAVKMMIMDAKRNVSGAASESDMKLIRDASSADFWSNPDVWKKHFIGVTQGVKKFKDQLEAETGTPARRAFESSMARSRSRRSSSIRNEE